MIPMKNIDKNKKNKNFISLFHCFSKWNDDYSK